MKEFILRKNLWTLDFITSIIYALCHGYFYILLTDNPEWYEKRVLIYGVLTYIFTFVLALCLRKRFVWLPSWAWLGIFGALIRILFLQLLHFPRLLDWHIKYSSSFCNGIYEIISDEFNIITLNWVIWAIAGLLCIFTVRVIAYLFQTIYISYYKSTAKIK
jgi:hypothetical protein